MKLMTNAPVCHAAPDLGGATANGVDAITAEEALKAEDARYAAQTSGDLAAMKRLFGDDLVYVHSSGDLDDKPGFIEAQRSKAVIYRTMQRSEVKVRVYGPVAIITGRGKFDVTVKGEERTVNILFHSIWVKRGGAVQFISWHAAAAPK
jgi:ketosteroid isomerase-like protein